MTVEKQLRKDKKFTYNFPFELRASNDEDGIIEGYASVFDVVDSYGTAIQKGAFEDTIKDKGATGIRVLFNHNADEVIGVPIELYEDNIGLFVRFKLVKGVQRADEVYKLLKAGALDSFSIGFVVKEDTYDRDNNVIKINRVELWEFSIVPFPANKMAMVTSVRKEDILEDEDTDLTELKQLNIALELQLLTDSLN